MAISSSGELTPELFGRIDLAKFQSGLAQCRNFIPLPHGAAVNRPGTLFIAPTKNSTNPSRLIPFSYNNVQTFAIEVGVGYFRWYTEGAVLEYQTPSAFDNTVNYAVGALCSEAGVNYYCIAQNGPEPPPNSSYWNALSSSLSAWVNSTNYSVGNACTLPGQTWYCIAPNGPKTPSNNIYWVVKPTIPHAYDNAKSYAVGALCSVGGNAYCCIAPTTANEPPNSTYWVALSGASPAAFSASTYYPIGALCTNGGITYCCICACGPVPPNVGPLNASYWVLAYTTSFPADYDGTVRYSVGSFCLYQSVVYYCTTPNGVASVTDTTHWYALPTNPNLYEIPNPYTASELFDIHFVQSADVLTLTHPNHPVLELRRYGAANWQLATPTFQSPTNCPTGVIATPTGTGTLSYQYLVTTVNQDNLEESIGSAPCTAITNNLNVAGNYNTITWTAPSTGTVTRYNVYSYSNGLFGYIGQADGATYTFKDINIEPDVSQTPPIDTTGFNDTTGDYPAAVSYFQQRRCFAGSANDPQNVWMTRSGTENNLSYRIPTVDDDAIRFRLAAREASAIRHIIPMANCILLTASCEWAIDGSNVVTPTNIAIRPQSYIGANNVPPVVVGTAILFAAARGGHIREMSYNWQAQSYLSQDISLLAPHLFDYLTIVDMAYSKSPYPILWCVSSCGWLLSMTYVPEQQIASWSRHDTQGTFESICTISENNQDTLYCIVNRTLNGATTRCVEVMAPRPPVNPYGMAINAPSVFVDCAATYSGSPATTLSGLTWLAGHAVNVLADGAVIPGLTVSNGGAITLPVAASVVTVGLPIVADLQTLPLAQESDTAAAQGREKNVNKIWLRVCGSASINAGPSFDNLTDYKQRSSEAFGYVPNPITDEIELVVPASWGPAGQVCIRQTDPLPLDVLSLTMEVATGG